MKMQAQKVGMQLKRRTVEHTNDRAEIPLWSSVANEDAGPEGGDAVETENCGAHQ